MQGDSKKTLIDRFYTLLHWQLAAQLPRPGGIHKYSHGALYKGFTTTITTANGQPAYSMEISKGIEYGAYVMGYDANGGKRNPRGPLERINFATIGKTTTSVAKCLALPTGGKVVIK